MCHAMTWDEWKLLQQEERQEERREDAEPRVAATADPEPAEAATEPGRDRELVRA